MNAKKFDEIMQSLRPHGQTGLVRMVSLPMKRPKDRRDIVTEVTIDWCQKKYRVEFTPRLVAECRAKHRKLKKKMRRYWPS